MTDWKAVSARIRERREAMGLSRDELGARVGSSYNYVAQVEGGLRISETKLAIYAEALGVSIPWLRYGVAATEDIEPLLAAARREGRESALAEVQASVARLVSGAAPSVVDRVRKESANETSAAEIAAGNAKPPQQQRQGGNGKRG